MICNSLSSVLDNLKGTSETSQYKEKPLLGEYNNILDPIEFEKFNKEFTRFVELTYKLDTKGELMFDTYETKTTYPYSSRYWRDDVNVNIYAQANEELFNALDDERIKSEIKEELQDYDILKEPEAEFPEDESLDPMYLKQTVQPVSDNFEIDPKKLADKSKNERAREVASLLAERLALKLGVQYQNITAEQAKEILGRRNKPYNNEPAFYFAGTVYTVGDNVNFDTVLHEFSHPFLRAIAKDNPVLFNNLYEELLNTPEGKVIKEHVIRNYPELSEMIKDEQGNDINNPLFMEEVLAYGLQKEAVNKVNEQVQSEGFSTFISNLMGALRKLFRKIFGTKAKLSDISADTSLTDLADKLLGEDFQYETELVTEEDIVSYAREIKEMAQQLTESTKAENIQAAINEMYTTNQLIINKAKNFKTRSPIYQKMLKEALFQKGSNQLLRRISKSLQGFQTVKSGAAYSIDEVIENTLEAESLRQTELANGARSFVNTVSIANTVAQNIYNDLAQMQKAKSFNSRDAVALLFLYRSTVRTWNDMFENFDELLLEQSEEFDITQQNDLVDLMNEVKNNLLRADNKIRDIYKGVNITT